jgi:hypothetical protein
VNGYSLRKWFARKKKMKYFPHCFKKKEEANVFSKQRILALSCRFERYQTTALARDEEYVFAVLRIYL